MVDKVAKELNITNAFGNLLPENKVQKVEELKKDKNNIIAFVGDGINDAPVLALSDVGIELGWLGEAMQLLKLPMLSYKPTSHLKLLPPLL